MAGSLKKQKKRTAAPPQPDKTTAKAGHGGEDGAPGFLRLRLITLTVAAILRLVRRVLTLTLLFLTSICF